MPEAAVENPLAVSKVGETIFGAITGAAGFAAGAAR
jgi:hypothetical protein